MKDRWLAELIKDRKRLVNYFVILVCLLIVISLSRNVRKIKRVREQIAEKEARVEQLKTENEAMKVRLNEISSDYYLEKQLRDGLGLTREGDVIVVLPDEEILRSLAPDLEEEEISLPDPNWKKWVHLFGIGI